MRSVRAHTHGRPIDDTQKTVFSAILSSNKHARLIFQNTRCTMVGAGMLFMLASDKLDGGRMSLGMCACVCVCVCVYGSSAERTIAVDIGCCDCVIGWRSLRMIRVGLP